jgi:hypothetical protein
MSTTTTQFDIDRFADAAQARDASTQLSMYAPHATVTIVDRICQPKSPRVLHNRGEIETWLTDLCGRDMTHRATRRVSDETRAAFTLECRYPDGTNVICSTIITLTDGQISEQSVVQVWDEQ